MNSNFKDYLHNCVALLHPYNWKSNYFTTQREREQVVQNYQDLLNMDDQDLVLNREPFDCPVCLVDYESGEGVVLRECIHTFCR